MLPASVADCISASIEAELPPRDRTLAENLSGLDSEFIRRGTFNSSMMLQARARAGGDELAVRAEILWAMIQRCYRAFGAPAGEQLASDLEQHIREHLARQTDIIIGLVSKNLAALRGQWEGLIRSEMVKRRSFQ